MRSRQSSTRRSSDLTRRPPEAGRLDHLEQSIQRSQWCLFLDVDGTLLELAESPADVQVEPSLNVLLDRVSRALGGALAFVSGRTVAEVDRLFEPRKWPAAGVHGLERRDAAGQWHAPQHVNSEMTSRALERMRALAGRLPGALLEDKGIGVALHYRQAPHHEAELRREVRAIARDIGTDVLMLEGTMVVELRAAGASKADAIRAFLAEAPFAGRIPIFMGDDLTDEPGLAAVERLGGLSVAVGDRVNAMVRVAGPRDVRVFLEELADTGAPGE
jgi:trehalose 6-phosphate phosphatase